MKTTLEIIQEEFYCLVDEGFCVSIQDVTNIYKKIIYKKLNIQVILECELMPRTIDFEITVFKNNILYSICEYDDIKREFYKNKNIINVVFQNVFDYTIGDFSQDSFYQAKRHLINNKKLFIKYLALYKSLICTALLTVNSI